MGFSVSGATAILFAGLLISFGAWHSAATDSFERVSEAEQFRADDALAEENTVIEITGARLVDSSTKVEIVVDNRGSVALSLNRTDLFLDNEHRDGWQSGVEFGSSKKPTDLWLPGETLTITFEETPTRVKIATERGVSDSAEVTS